MGKKHKKTNAMRILDQENIPYDYYEYEVIEGQTDGMTVARQIKKDPKQVFKTLVTEGASKSNYVFVLPVGKTLNLKKAAQFVGEKKVEMVPMKTLLALTGYIHGGCSPVGMKKAFITVIDESANIFETIICSGGKRGLQIEVALGPLIQLVNARLADICND